MIIQSRIFQSLKSKSQSLPTHTDRIVQRSIHKNTSIKQRYSQEIKSQQNGRPKMISLTGLGNKQEEQLSNKIKVISKRNTKKLEERYETIDRWKNKYLPQSQELLKFKLSFESAFPQLQKQQQFSNRSDFSIKMQAKQPKTLPMISKKSISATISEQIEYTRRLQTQLVARLERNKRFSQIKVDRIEKQINFIEQSQHYIPVEKRRQIQLKKLFLKSEKDKHFNKVSGLFSKKITLAIPSLELKQNQVRAKSDKIRETKDLLQSSDEKRQSKSLKKAQSIHQFKEQLLQQAVQQIPVGWDIGNDIHIEHTDENLS